MAREARTPLEPTSDAQVMHGLALGSIELAQHVAQGRLDRWPKFLRLHQARACQLPVPAAVLIAPSMMEPHTGASAEALKGYLRSVKSLRGPWHLRGAMEHEDSALTSQAGLSITIERIPAASSLLQALRARAQPAALGPSSMFATEPNLDSAPGIHELVLVQHSVSVRHLCVCATTLTTVDSSGPWIEVYARGASLAGASIPRWSGPLAELTRCQSAAAGSVWRLWQRTMAYFGADAGDLEIVVDPVGKAHLVQLRPYLGVDPFQRATMRGASETRSDRKQPHPRPFDPFDAPPAQPAAESVTWSLDKSHQSQALSPAHLDLVEMLSCKESQPATRVLHGWLYERDAQSGAKRAKNGVADKRRAPGRLLEQTLCAIEQHIASYERWTEELGTLGPVELAFAYPDAIAGCRAAIRAYGRVDAKRGAPSRAKRVRVTSRLPILSRADSRADVRSDPSTSSLTLAVHRCAQAYLLGEWDLSSLTLADLLTSGIQLERGHNAPSNDDARATRGVLPASRSDLAASRWRADVDHVLKAHQLSDGLRWRLLGELDDLLFSLGLLHVRSWYLECAGRLGLSQAIGGDSLFALRSRAFLSDAGSIIARLLQTKPVVSPSHWSALERLRLQSWLEAQAQRPPPFIEQPLASRQRGFVYPDVDSQGARRPNDLLDQSRPTSRRSAKRSNTAAVAIGGDAFGILRYVPDLSGLVAQGRLNELDLSRLILALPTLTAPAVVLLAELGVRFVVVEHGGALSHAALMCAELGLHALIGCGRLPSDLYGQEVELNMEARTISRRLTPRERPTL